MHVPAAPASPTIQTPKIEISFYVDNDLIDDYDDNNDEYEEEDKHVSSRIQINFFFSKIVWLNS